MRLLTVLLSGILISVLFSSCVQQKNVVYFHENFQDSIQVYKEYYKIQKEDILYIQTKSLLQDNLGLFIDKGSENNRMNNEMSLLLNGYLVDLEGNIELPIIGKVHLDGLTLSEAESLINKKLGTYLKNSYVTIRLLNYKITLIGEVNAPNTYTFYNNSITIFEAISRAGDITDYGNKREVLIIRQINDKKTTFKIDLTDVRTMRSDTFYLLPNDIVYVSPIKGKFFRENLPVYTFALSTLTTFILLLNYIGL